MYFLASPTETLSCSITTLFLIFSGRYSFLKFESFEQFFLTAHTYIGMMRILRMIQLRYARNTRDKMKLADNMLGRLSANIARTGCYPSHRNPPPVECYLQLQQ